MNSITRLVSLVAGLVLLLTITPSWGQPVCVAPGCNPTASDANKNTAGGTGALVNVDETINGGLDNTAFGFSALASTTIGDSNTATGKSVLQSNTTGSANTASGRHALTLNTTGNRNTASGRGALQSNTDGSNNTASGANALQSNTTGDDNTVSGFHALDNNLTGSRNTAVGVEALVHSLGDQNIAIGFGAGSTPANGSNNIYLANVGVADESQTMRLGDTQTRTFIVGIATTNVNGATVEINTTTGQLGVKNSSARYKRDIAPMGTSSEKVLALRPVTFAYKDDAQGVTRYGLIAEEVAAVYPELVTHTATGEVQTVRYQELIPMLLNELQRQQQVLQRQEEALAGLSTLQKELAELRALVGSRTEGGPHAIVAGSTFAQGEADEAVR
jgi:hypothetical protein